MCGVKTPFYYNWYEGSGSNGVLGGYRIFITETSSTHSDMRKYFASSQSVNIEIYEDVLTTSARTKTLTW